MELSCSLQIPSAFEFLFEPARFKVVFGGRGGAKSWSIVDALLLLGMQKPLRILCARELQNSIADSVHRLLCDRISEHNLDGFYKITQKSIEGVNGTAFLFKGLKHNYREIKSTEGIDICWCFPAGTLVDGRPIETLREGDLVNSFNHATGKIELRPVVRAIKNTCPAVMIKVLTSNGSPPILCTSEHPIFTKGRGYIAASELQCGDIVYEKIEYSGISAVLRRLWGNDRNKFQGSPRKFYKKWRSTLHGLRKASIDRESHKAQSNARSCLSRKDIGGEKESIQERRCWQWSRDDKSAKRVIGKAWAWVVAGTRCPNKKIPESADKLQIGFSECVLHALHRMRWSWTQWGSGKGRGRKKKYVLAERRVDSVEIQEQENIGLDGRSDGRNYVYNIEVEGNNNYFAEGILVHNCEDYISCEMFVKNRYHFFHNNAPTFKIFHDF